MCHDSVITTLWQVVSYYDIWTCHARCQIKCYPNCLSSWKYFTSPAVCSIQWAPKVLGQWNCCCCFGSVLLHFGWTTERYGKMTIYCTLFTIDIYLAHNYLKRNQNKQQMHPTNVQSHKLDVVTTLIHTVISFVCLLAYGMSCNSSLLFSDQADVIHTFHVVSQVLSHYKFLFYLTRQVS
jgi:hypothetical protein